MAQLLTVDLLLEGRIWCNVNNQASVTTLHWKVQSIVGGAPTDENFLTAVEAIYGPLFKSMINARATYLGCTMQIITPPIGLLRLNSTNTGAGEGGADELPSQSSGLIEWGTNLGGRAYRGRIYLPFPSAQANQSTGVPNAGYLVGMGEIGDEYIGHVNWTLAGATCVINPALRHRKNKAGSTPAPTLLTSYRKVLQWATQRKRGQLGRPNVSPF